MHNLKKNIQENRIFLLDAMALIYRSYFAFIRSPIYTSKKINVSAIYGFINTLLHLIKTQKPTHIAIAFDTKDPTFRHEMFPKYKANRDSMPEDLSAQIPHIKDLISNFNIPIIECPGWEADDIIGTISKKFNSNSNNKIFLVTSDKDYAQLVTDNVSIYKPSNQNDDPKILNFDTICSEWQIDHPINVIDVLGLWGDSSDNIPGVPGIGEKKSKKLISEFKTIENLINNIPKTKGKLNENLTRYQEQALLSKKLVTIDTYAPVNIELDQITKRKYNNDRLKEFLTKFEFHSIIKRLFKPDLNTNDKKSEKNLNSLNKNSNIKKNYAFIRPNEKNKILDLISNIKQNKSFSFKLKTTSVKNSFIFDIKIIGISFSYRPNESFYVEMPLAEELIFSKLENINYEKNKPIIKEFLKLFSTIFSNKNIIKIGHNIKLDIGVLNSHGINVSNPIFDTMLAHIAINNEGNHTLNSLSKSILKYEFIYSEKIEAKNQINLFSKEEISQDKSSYEKNFNLIAEYTCEQSDVIFQLVDKLNPLIQDLNQNKVLFEIEFPLIPILVKMEQEGINLNTNELKLVGDELQKKIDSYQSCIFEESGTEFNLNSPKQIGEILFDKLKLEENPKKTKTGQYRTNESVLYFLSKKHQIVQDMLNHRELSKLKNTYIDSLPNYIYPKTKKIHTTFSQLLTSTGRLTSNNPNLQNIPIRSKNGKKIRKAFVPRNDDYLIFSSDYSQIELRVMAELSQDKNMMQAFKNKLDIHNATASKVFNVSHNDVTDSMRRTSKMVNFGIIYGISAFGLSQRLKGEVSRVEASEIIKSYFKEFPGVKEFQESTIINAQKEGFVETIMGRRRYLPDINSKNSIIKKGAERTAINTPIQGTAADIIKIAMINISKMIERDNYKTKLLLQIHDELIFDMHKSEVEILPNKIENLMINVLNVKVPIVVNSKTGENWLEAH